MLKSSKKCFIGNNYSESVNSQFNSFISQMDHCAMYPRLWMPMSDVMGISNGPGDGDDGDDDDVLCDVCVLYLRLYFFLVCVCVPDPFYPRIQCIPHLEVPFLPS